MGEIIDRARQLRKTIESLSAGMDDATARDNPEIVPAWKEDRTYKAGDRVRAGDRILRATAPFEKQDDPENPLIVFEEVTD